MPSAKTTLRLMPLLSISLQGLSSIVNAFDLDVSNKAAVASTASQIAQGLYANYHNQGSTAGDFDQPKPWFWWLSGSGWTGLIDYMVYTGDGTYKADLFVAYAKNLGSGNDFAPKEQYSWEANDDQMYWLYGALTAMEYGFDSLPCQQQNGDEKCANSWLAINTNAINMFARRWQADNGTCGGGLKWQYRTSEPGYTYKNAVTNGGFFQTAARMARYTGNLTYEHWADIIYDWSTSVGLVTNDFHVKDGTSDADGQNCRDVNAAEWSYNIASYMYGAANMYAYYALQKPDDKVNLDKWEARVQGFVNTARSIFFTDRGVMYEQNCERSSVCSTDQTSFKSSLARWMAKTAVLVPSVQDQVVLLLKNTAQAAAATCDGNTKGAVCGQKWTTGQFDGQSDFGTQLSALEAVQSLLAASAPPLLTKPKSV